MLEKLISENNGLKDKIEMYDGFLAENIF